MSAKIKPENMPIKKYTSEEALPMVIKLQINNLSVRRVSVNPSSQTNILHWSVFLKMRLSESIMLKPCQANFTGFLEEGVRFKGYIDLDTRFGNGRNAKVIKVRYMVVDSSSAYNVVIGRPALKALKAVISVADLTMEYPVGNGKVGVVEADLEMAKKCHEMCPYTI
jgi:hypothetical protein